MTKSAVVFSGRKGNCKWWLLSGRVVESLCAQGLWRPRCVGSGKKMGIALRAHWAWLQRVSTKKPWLGLDIPISPKEQSFVAASTLCSVGDGMSILFWEDSWVQGSSIWSLTPTVYAAVSARFQKKRTVAEALQDRHWIRDITSALGIQTILEYLSLWCVVRDVRLS